jgi:hypothetical protein
MCPSCLAAIERREIDMDAMELAAEALGGQARERPSRALGRAVDW